MRKISQALRLHKPALALAAVLAAAGCGGGGGEDHPAPASGTAAALPCPVVVDSTGWLAFKALTARIDAGEDVSRADLEAMAEVPAFARWSAAFPNGPAPTPARFGNWLERTFATELGRDLPRKINADLRTFTRSYRWSHDHAGRIDARLAAMDSVWCRLDARLRRWLPADVMPDTVRVVVLPARPEVRYGDGRFFVDTGVLIAGTSDQLVRQLTGLGYSNLALLDGPNPLQLEGEAAVAQVMRLMVNAGVVNWLEDLPHTFFDPEHPTLHKVHEVPEGYWNIAVRIVPFMDAQLAQLFADPDTMAARGQEFARAMVGSGGVGQASWCMAVAIARRLGEDRLREASRSVPGFFAAYQEAVAANTGPRPELHEVPGAYEEALSPLSPAVAARLQELLVRTFPPGP